MSLFLFKIHLQYSFELFDDEFEEYSCLTRPNCGNETFIPTLILDVFNLKKHNSITY